MKIVFGFLFFGLVLFVCAGWVLKLGRLGLMMIVMTICVPAALGCALDLHGSRRYWAIAPAAAFLVLAVLTFYEWNRMMKS
jgi:hypothetical protein